ncbi:uncharacterized protein ARMOST_22127 [Armillaria ostoyae]|uniref:Uncharacterized protein n=1 Tax=Armillaria ostoyae TaxID=47428 RepID=A0A284SC02_ARMOS|nr:uncharacterized protein ARMOST_22127 [Armillaria ostoyae]
MVYDEVLIALFSPAKRTLLSTCMQTAPCKEKDQDMRVLLLSQRTFESQPSADDMKSSSDCARFSPAMVPAETISPRRLHEARYRELGTPSSKIHRKTSVW